MPRLGIRQLPQVQRQQRCQRIRQADRRALTALPVRAWAVDVEAPRHGERVSKRRPVGQSQDYMPPAPPLGAGAGLSSLIALL